MKKRKLEKGELGFVIALGIFSIICLLASAKLFKKTPVLSGDGAMPLLTSGIMLAMVLLIIKEMHNCPGGFGETKAFGQKFIELIKFIFPGKTGLITLYCIAYAVVLKLVGFIPSTFVFLAGSMLTLNPNRKVRTIIITVATIACILVLFQFIFKVQLP